MSGLTPLRPEDWALTGLLLESFLYGKIILLQFLLTQLNVTVPAQESIPAYLLCVYDAKLRKNLWMIGGQLLFFIPSAFSMFYLLFKWPQI